MKRSSAILLACVGLGLSAVAAVAAGCSGDENTGTGAGGPGGTGTGASGGTGSGGGLGFGGGEDDGGLTPDSACAAQEAEATLTKRPVDVIIVIDNSGSMTSEIVAVQDNINVNFASIIEASGIDYRVIMIADHGSASGSQSVCVEMPLSSASCSPIPPEPGQNPPIFFHYSNEIASHNSLCRVLDTFAGGVPDDYGFAPNGWSEWLRPDSLKVFVEITDDGTTCSTSTLAQNVSLDDNDNGADGLTAGAAFDAALLALSPAHFGDATLRNYVFYSIVGVSENDPATAPWQPGDPMVPGHCSTAVAPGTAYQALSMTTGGLRFPMCQTGSYDAVFQAIADGVISGATVECEFPVPDPPPGETIDLSTVQVEYTPGGGGPKQTFTQVPNALECGPGKFYIDADVIHLCGEACATVQSDDAAKLSILYGCTGVNN
ncbi:MAG: hypothetical protein IT372_06440 [Polyangiaceae bacterium]|nr:hypothetical protein [Polyangiaceae bacterium]